MSPGTKKGNKVSIEFKGDNNNVLVLNVDDKQSSNIIDKIGQAKNALTEKDNLVHKKQALYFVQAKKGKSQKGNFGKIDAISTNSLSVTFEKDDVKNEILKGEQNPLTGIYIVDVEVQIVRDEPRIYKVLELYEIIDDEQ